MRQAQPSPGVMLRRFSAEASRALYHFCQWTRGRSGLKPHQGDARRGKRTHRVSLGASAPERSEGRDRSTHAFGARPSLGMRVQLLQRALQVLQLLSRLPQLAFCGQTLVIGKVFGRLRDEDAALGNGA